MASSSSSSSSFFYQYEEKQIVYQEVKEPVEGASKARSSLTSPAERFTEPPLTLPPGRAVPSSSCPCPRGQSSPQQSECRGEAGGEGVTGQKQSGKRERSYSRQQSENQLQDLRPFYMSM